MPAARATPAAAIAAAGLVASTRRILHTDAEDAKYEAVTLEQVKAVATKYLDTNAVVISIVKP
jgi:predicted Zn-dependent peptidase